MLVTFKKRFHAWVKEGSKRHTFRAPRKDGKLPKIGEGLHCYGDARQKTMFCIGRWPCIRVEPGTIVMTAAGKLKIRIGDVLLSDDEAAVFAWVDGFRASRNRNSPDNLYLMKRYWMQTHGLAPGGSFSGFVYYWNFDAPIKAKKKGKKKA